MPGGSGWKKFYGSIWRCFYDQNSKTAERFNTKPFQRKIRRRADFVEHDPAMQNFWEAYRKKFSYASALEWDVIMKAIRRLYALCENDASV